MLNHGSPWEDPRICLKRTTAKPGLATGATLHRPRRTMHGERCTPLSDFGRKCALARGGPAEGSRATTAGQIGTTFACHGPRENANYDDDPSLGSCPGQCSAKWTFALNMSSRGISCPLDFLALPSCPSFPYPFDGPTINEHTQALMAGDQTIVSQV